MTASQPLTLTAKTLPANLKSALAPVSTRRGAAVKATFDGFEVPAFNTRWDGGSKTYFYVWDFTSEHLTVLEPEEGSKVTAPAGCGIVCVSHFCGKEYVPVVYVRDTDLPAFFGVPMEYTMPGFAAADRLCEMADDCGSDRAGKAKAKACRAAADTIRALNGVVTA